ncbi:MAG: phosphate butyryltransferase Ptb [Oscillospiraceae bacterium]|nr:phosphate butyryltransferase Ptb [Oscillospiraceae bacterium]
MNITSLSALAAEAKKRPRRAALSVVCPYDAHTLGAVLRASREGVVRARLFGEPEKINAAFEALGEDPGGLETVRADSNAEALAAAVAGVRGDRGIIMKGLLDTSDFLRAVLSKESGLRGKSGGLLSAFGIFEAPSYHKLFAVTDFAMNIAPDLSAKRAILENAAAFLRSVGVDKPKIAALSEAEHVNPKIPASSDAAELKRLNEAGEITDCVIDGPIAFDIATSREAAEIKGYSSPVAGDADLLLAPEIVSGNILVKSLTGFGGARTAGVVLGADVPVVMTSRSAEEDDKYYSIILAALGAGAGAEK